MAGDGLMVGAKAVICRGQKKRQRWLFVYLQLLSVTWFRKNIWHFKLKSKKKKPFEVVVFQNSVAKDKDRNQAARKWDGVITGGCRGPRRGTWGAIITIHSLYLSLFDTYSFHIKKK